MMQCLQPTSRFICMRVQGDRQHNSGSKPLRSAMAASRPASTPQLAAACCTPQPPTTQVADLLIVLPLHP